MRRLLVFVVIGLAAVLLPGMAHAQTPPAHNEEMVTEIRLDGQFTSLVFEFSEEVPRSLAEDAVQDIQDSHDAALRESQNDYPTMTCGDYHMAKDENGTWTFAQYCGPEGRTGPWGFRLSEAVQETVVGLVSERGMMWWMSSVSQPMLAPHVEPPDYQFHGTFKPTWQWNTLEYQDYFTWRHNIGTGGTASLTIAGGYWLNL